MKRRWTSIWIATRTSTNEHMISMSNKNSSFAYNLIELSTWATSFASSSKICLYSNMLFPCMNHQSIHMTIYWIINQLSEIPFQIEIFISEYTLLVFILCIFVLGVIFELFLLYKRIIFWGSSGSKQIRCVVRIWFSNR